MDPLSISASAVALIGAATAVTKGINGLIRCYQTADTRLTALGDEVTSLQSLLHTVKRTFATCQNLSLAGAEEDYWRQSELSILDCQVTLGELGTLVNKIKDNAACKSFGWKMRATLDLNSYGPDIATAREKVNKSHWALQTMLHTVNVSLSIQNNSSAKDISFKLDRLKSSIDEALRVALKAGSHDFGQSHASESHVARNLRNLAEAAKHFHSAASSAASSKASSTASSGGDSAVAGLRLRAHRHGPSPAERDVVDPSTLLGPSSLLGDFPTYRRERVEEFLFSQRQHPKDDTSDVGTPARVASPAPSSTISAPVPLRPTRPHIGIPVIEEEEDDEAEFEKMFLDGLEDLARDSIRVSDFDKAIELLTEAIRREEKTSSNKEDFRRLQTQLALCHFFKGDWRLAEPLVDVLARSITAKSDGELDHVVWTLTHALAIAHLEVYAFDKALKLCKKALQGRKRLAKKSGLPQEEAATCSDSTGLLATIYQMKGDYIAAEIYRRQIPTDFKYEHPAFALEYLISSRELLEDVLGDDLPDICEPVTVQTLPGSHELVGSMPQVSAQAMPRRQTLRRRRTTNGGDMSPLRTRRHQWEKFESDTSKEVFIAPPASETDADDEASSLAWSSDEPTETSPTKPVQPIGQPSHGLRRRMTTIFVKRRRNSKDDESSDSEQSTTAVSPLRRWFKGGNIFGKGRLPGPPRSKTVLRKNVRPLVRSEAVFRPFGRKAPQTFRHLRMNSYGRFEEVTSTSSAQSSKDQLATLRWLPAELDNSVYSSKDSTLDEPSTPASSASTQEPRQKLAVQDYEKDYMEYRNGVLYINTQRPRRLAHPPAYSPSRPALPELSGTTKPTEAGPFELANILWDGIPKPDPVDEPEAKALMPTFSLADGFAALSRKHDWCDMSYLAFPAIAGVLTLTAIEARNAYADIHQDDDWDEATAICKAERAAYVSSELEQPAASKPETGSLPSDTSVVVATSSCRPKELPPAMDLSLAAPASARPSATASETLSHLADILITIQGRKKLGPGMRRATAVELTVLLGRLGRLNPDMMVCGDVKRVIASLEGSFGPAMTTSTKAMVENDDSGYESMSPERKDADSSDEESVRVEADPPPSRQDQDYNPEAVGPEPAEVPTQGEAALLSNLDPRATRSPKATSPQATVPPNSTSKQRIPCIAGREAKLKPALRAPKLSIMTPIEEVATPVSVLKRRPSWVSGDERVFWQVREDAVLPPPPVASSREGVHNTETVAIGRSAGASKKRVSWDVRASTPEKALKRQPSWAAGDEERFWAPQATMPGPKDSAASKMPLKSSLKRENWDGVAAGDITERASDPPMSTGTLVLDGVAPGERLTRQLIDGGH